MVFYASGSCINVVECMNYNISESQVLHGYRIVGECPSEMHVKVVAADQPITAFAIHPKENTIAYSERHSKCIKIVKWSQVSGIVTNIARLECKDVLTQHLLIYQSVFLVSLQMDYIWQQQAIYHHIRLMCGTGELKNFSLQRKMVDRPISFLSIL